MKSYTVVLRHVNNPENVVTIPHVMATSEKYAVDSAKRMYMLPQNWELVSVTQE